MLKQIFNFFSQYVNPFEKKVDKFLRKINSTSSSQEVHKKLIQLMQENTAVLSIWLEKKYRNYRYLSKKNRKKMYENLEKIEVDFSKTLSGDEDQEQYLEKIMAFLRPNKRFYYEESSSFGKLLKNANKMIGDCNQIVTFYIHLFAKKFPVNEIEIKILPGHVCLHFKGKDIEATAGAYKQYNKYEHILPVTEIVSTNLLDIHDFREFKKSIAVKDILKSSQLAYILSSLKEIVAKNLNIAYIKIAIELAEKKEFQDAIFFLEKTTSDDSKQVLKNVVTNAVKYFLDKNDFSRAKFFAKKAVSAEIDRFVLHSEVIYLVKANNFQKARGVAEFLGDRKLVNYVYEKEYFVTMEKVRHIKKLSDAMLHKDTYLKLIDLAKKAGREDLKKWPESIINQLRVKN